MKLFIITSIFFIALCFESIVAQPGYVYTLDTPFQVDVFIAYYSYFSMALETLPNNDLIVSNTTFTKFNLTNGILSSQSNGDRYYLQNQTGIRYPSYALKRGQPKFGDVAIFKASANHTYYGRYIAPNITAGEPGPANLWVACKTNDNVYTIGWDADSNTKPPEGCTNYAQYNPGVLLHVGPF